MRKKIVLAAVLTVAWAAALTIAPALLALASGASTVWQMDASNTSYLASLSLVAGAHMATVVITGLFVLALYLIFHTEK